MVIDRLLPEALERIKPLAEKVVLQGERVMVVLSSQQSVDQATRCRSFGQSEARGADPAQGLRLKISLSARPRGATAVEARV